MVDGTEIMVFEAQELTGEWPPQNAVMFLLWLQRKLADVHPCYRDKVKIEIGHEWQHGSYIKLSYPRPTPGLASTNALLFRTLAFQASSQHARWEQRNSSPRSPTALRSSLR